MIAAWLGILAVLVALGAIFGAIKLADRWLAPPAELLRKLVHVGTGAVVLTFPWLFDRQWPVVLLSGLTAGALLALRGMPRLRDGFGSILYGVRRPSLGEIYFALAVCALFWLSARDPLLYCVPILILTLADAVAALIGITYGRVRYVTSEGLKSAEGSIAFFAIAFLSVHVPLLLFTDVGRPQTLLIAVIIGVLSMLIEAAAWRGLDNLLIPIGAFAFLKLYLDKPVDALTLRLLATIALLVFSLSWRKRSSLDDSALMAGALFGYGALMLGGPLWLIAPVAFFVAHAWLWPTESARRDHTVFAVLSVITTALLWLALHVRDALACYPHAYAVTFGAHFAIVGVSRIPLSIAGGEQVRRLGVWVGLGWAFSLAQSLLFAIAAGWPTLAYASAVVVGGGVGVAIGAATFFLMRPRLYAPRATSDSPIHWTGFAGGLAGSLAAFLICAAAQSA